MAAPSNSLANALSAPWLAGKPNPSGAKKGNSLANALSGPWLTSKSGPSGANNGVKTYVDNIFSPTARQNVSASPTDQPSGMAAAVVVTLLLSVRPMSRRKPLITSVR